MIYYIFYRNDKEMAAMEIEMDRRTNWQKRIKMHLPLAWDAKQRTCYSLYWELKLQRFYFSRFFVTCFAICTDANILAG